MNCRRVFSGDFIADGVPGYTDFPPSCQKGGSYKRARNKSNRRNKNKKQTKKKTRVPKTKTMKTKKVDLIIEGHFHQGYQSERYINLPSLACDNRYMIYQNNQFSFNTL